MEVENEGWVGGWVAGQFCIGMPHLTHLSGCRLAEKDHIEDLLLTTGHDGVNPVTILHQKSDARCSESQFCGRCVFCGPS